MRKSYVNDMIVVQLSIICLRNKLFFVNFLRINFLFVKELLSQNLDLLIINEMKLDEIFLNAQFQIKDCKCLRKNNNIFGNVSVFK